MGWGQTLFRSQKSHLVYFWDHNFALFIISGILLNFSKGVESDSPRHLTTVNPPWVYHVKTSSQSLVRSARQCHRHCQNQWVSFFVYDAWNTWLGTLSRSRLCWSSVHLLRIEQLQHMFCDYEILTALPIKMKLTADTHKGIQQLYAHPISDLCLDCRQWCS